MNEPDDLLTTSEVALMLRAPDSTLRYWRYLGSGPKSFRLGRRVVYRRRDVNDWLANVEAAGHRQTTS